MNPECCFNQSSFFFCFVFVSLTWIDRFFLPSFLLSFFLSCFLLDSRLRFGHQPMNFVSVPAEKNPPLDFVVSIWFRFFKMMMMMIIFNLDLDFFFFFFLYFEWFSVRYNSFIYYCCVDQLCSIQTQHTETRGGRKKERKTDRPTEKEETITIHRPWWFRNVCKCLKLGICALLKEEKKRKTTVDVPILQYCFQVLFFFPCRHLWGRERDREFERVRDRQTDRQTDWQTDRQETFDDSLIRSGNTNQIASLFSIFILKFLKFSNI